MSHEPLIIFDFSSKSDIENWRIVDDGVMGGRSEGNFKLNKNGHGEFFGDVSLKNNGGFSSLRHNFQNLKVSDYSTFEFRIKGDGKAYQFRSKSTADQRHSYLYNYETNGEWQTIQIPMREMYPSFRGRKLDMPNYAGEELSEITFLIANKREESFQLEIDWIKLK